MLKEIISPKLSGYLHRFFNQSVDIQSFTSTKGQYGEEVKTWTNSMQGVKCRVAPKKDGEIQRDDKSFVVASHEIIINGNYEITESDRAVLAGENFEILLVKHDSEGQNTYLSVRRFQNEPAS